MKTTEIYPPLKVVQDQPFKELASWEEIENIRLMLTSLGKRWQENIYLPTWGIAIGIQMLKDVTATKNMLFGASIVLAALASWRRYKEAYRFAPELEMLLYGQAGECKLPIGVLQYLPYSCFYMETPNLCPNKYHGFFICMDQNVDQTTYILRCLGVSPDGEIIGNYDLKLEEGTTLEEAIETHFAEEVANVVVSDKKKFTLDELTQGMIERKYIIPKLLQIILYICAQNSDIRESQKGRSGKAITAGFIKDKYREIRTWDVGYRIINKMQISRDYSRQRTGNETTNGEESETAGNMRRVPRPHLRRGHWHFFWTGKRTQSDRKMVLRWVAPTLIGGKSLDELPVVINCYHKNIE